MIAGKTSKQYAVQAIFILSFIAYILLLIKLIIFKFPDAMTHEILSNWSWDAVVRHVKQTNIVPFKTIVNSFFNDPLPGAWKIVLYNIIAFVPMGFLLPCIHKTMRNLRTTLVVGVLMTLTLEVVQMVTILGEADIDDVILNLIGVLFGYICYQTVYALWQNIFQKTRNHTAT